MTHGIERRLIEELFNFVLVSEDHYEDLGRYRPEDLSFHQILESFITDGWRLGKEAIWYHAVHPAGAVPDQGFKIHLSATSRTAAEVLRRAVPLCLAAGAPFKALVDPFMVDFANSKNFSRGSSGKFLTVYPPDGRAFRELLDALVDATRDLPGPYILSDRPYRDSRTVFYRYGGFRPRVELNLFGERIPVIAAADGSVGPDLRAPYFTLPPGVDDPFPSPEPAHRGQVVLRDRYRIGGPFRHSNSGGVYYAEDRETGRRVVVKEARPFVNLTSRGAADAVAMLEKEARVLRRLQHTPFVPRFVDFFREWEHSFLVEEYVAGVLLASWRAMEGVGLLVEPTPTAGRVAEFCRRLGRLAQGLLAALDEFHRRGIVVGDLSPANVLVDPDRLTVTLIDFEGAFVDGEGASALDATVTTGFVHERRLRGEAPSFADDHYSLGAVLYSVILPIEAYFPLNPGARRPFLDAVVRDYDLPAEVSTLIFALLDGDLEPARAAAAALAALPAEEAAATPVPPATPPTARRRWSPRLADPARVSEADVRATVEAIADHVLAAADPDRADRLWPADYRVFLTNPLSVAYGALGTALFLAAAGRELPAAVRRWIERQPLDGERYPPGLFVGLAGVAWALDRLGFPEPAARAIELAYASPLAHQGPDVFYGAAGLGLAALYFWGRTGEPRHLAAARRSADALTASAEAADAGPFWTNVDGVHYYGYAHGGSGIAYFFLQLHRATGEAAHLDFGRSALEHEISAARHRDDHAAWFRSAGDQLLSPYWRYGAAGIGSVLVRYAAALDDDRYRDLAARAARYAAAKYVVFPGQLVGLGGMGEFLLDMYRATGDLRYLGDAWRLAETALRFAVPRPPGVAFPGEELLRLATDFGTGSAGVGLFLLRLLTPGDRLFYDFAIPKGRA